MFFNVFFKGISIEKLPKTPAIAPPEDPQLMADVAAVSMARLMEFSSRVLVSIAWVPWDPQSLGVSRRPDPRHSIKASTDFNRLIDIMWFKIG